MQTPKVTEITRQQLADARRIRHLRQLELVRESVLLGVVAPNDQRSAA